MNRCGNDALVLYWNAIGLLVIKNGDWIKFTYDAICLVQEIDGVRIISNFNCEFLQKVPGIGYNLVVNTLQIIYMPKYNSV